ncbi:lipoprotein-releasing ABC transporter permease subunit [Spongorhabdus nitratireducens]
MFRPLAFFIGLRYTRAKRRNHFISFISLTSMLGMTLGVAVLIIVLSVMNGFDRELKQRVLGMVPHATLTDAAGSMSNWQELIDQVDGEPGFVGAAPFVNAQAMLTYRGAVKGALVNGIDPAMEAKVSIVDENMKAGSLENLEPGEFGIVLGEILAAQLGARMGDKVTMVLPEASVNPAGVFPRLKRFTVVGLFGVGADLDANLGYINIQDAARFKRLPKDSVEGIRLETADLFEAPKLVWQFANKLYGRYYISDWTRTHGQLFQAIQMEKTMVGLLLTIIVAVAAFNIVSTLVMVVTDKQADIAILRTYGLTPMQVMQVFMVQGTLIGVTGTVSGVILGVLGAWNVSAIVAAMEKMLGVQFLNPNVYFISYLPSQLQWPDVALISVAGLILSFIATLYPAWRASRTQPAEALRYE